MIYKDELQNKAMKLPVAEANYLSLELNANRSVVHYKFLRPVSQEESQHGLEFFTDCILGLKKELKNTKSHLNLD
ncbi:hypothetical protein [Pontibacter burrus]|uniref:Uncharacterized protein n=1 Tax=Pontibacter burrus TaxID=2704466 RepID=A0A6B3LRG9_9BACT|nr:hypothetical protein [Pontibacter burrus]NEM99442.1 hypothetical protein [Pontibacter burrus]